MKSELLEKFLKLQWLLHKLRIHKSTQIGPMADTTRGQGRILALLKMQDNISTKDLSYLLGIRVSSLNELLTKMEKTGYLTREPSEEDKRIMLAKLTEKGRTEQQQEWEPNNIFACLSEEEQKTFSGYLDRVATALEAEVGEQFDDNNEHAHRMRKMRKHLGDEEFERMSAMRHGGFGRHRHEGHRGHEGRHGHEDHHCFGRCRNKNSARHSCRHDSDDE